MPASRQTAFLALGISAVAAAIVAALVVLGPPREHRARRMDERRVDDLTSLGRATDLYWSRHGKLPANLGDLAPEPGWDLATQDPETQQLYEYRVLGDDRYELCARFQQPSARPSPTFWSHPAGRHCFALEVREVTR